MPLRRALALSALAVTAALTTTLTTAIAAADHPAPSVTPSPSPTPKPASARKAANTANSHGVAPSVTPRALRGPGVTPAPYVIGDTGEGKHIQVLTLHEAISMALQENIDIQWHKTDLRLNDAAIRVAWGDFDPQLAINSTYTDSKTPQNPTIITSADTAQQILLEQEAIAEIEANVAPTPAPLPSTNSTPAPSAGPAVNSQPFIFENQDFRNTADIQGKLPLGTTYKFGAEVDHLDDTVLGLNQTFLPSNVVFAGVSIDQPLLQGFGYDANLVSVRIGRRNRQVSFNNWHQRVIDSVGQVMAAYFDMSYAQELMRLRNQSMEADRSLAQGNQRRVDVGLMTPIDVRQAEVDVSADQYDYLTAQNLLTSRVADLKRLIYRGVEQDDGRTYLTSGPIDLPVPVLDRDSLLADAFRYRVDYATAIQQSAIEDIRLKYYKNQLLPHIDVVGTLGINGLSTQSAGSSLSSALNGQGPEWSIGVQGTIPFGNVTGRANLASSERLKEEAVWKLKQVELSINTDVDTAISAIRTNEQRITSSRQAQQLAEEVVKMESGRLDQGQASTLDVLDNRRRLYDAQSAVLEAFDDLNKSIVQLYLATGTLLQHESIGLDDNDPDAPRPHKK